MTSNLKPYESIKNSGVSWLGAVPKHWHVERLKSSVSNIVETDKFGASTPGPRIALEHVESWTGRVSQGEATVPFDSQLKRFNPEDVLFGKLRPYLAKVTRLPTGGYCVGEFLVLRPKDLAVQSGYLERLLRSKPVIDTIDASTFGARMPRADWGFIGNLALVRPPLTEQAAIARFLDHMDRRIQKYIRAKEKLIALLDEYKQALIHQAVTGQIDVRTGEPYEEYKESGVEWLGRVPVHWSVCRNGRLFTERNERGFGDLPILEVSLRTGICVRDMKAGTRKQQIDDRDNYKRTVQGDIAYNMMRMWQGAVGVAPVDGLISPAYVVAQPLTDVASRYYEYLFRTADYKRQVNMASRGIVPDRNRLYWDQFKQLPSVCPPPEDQNRVAHFLDAQADLTSQAIHDYELLIGLVSELRQVLIGQVVTGKLDVREAVARLPNLDPVGDDSASNSLNPSDSLGLDEATAVA